ncbi:hypothetical protein NLG97_g9066 [Lecanicillium saksenae]|uniref:Uncharacterized protein n=1 Tax=Lecanicillium saksenae TaxID=468837 RepID=A0ACC1QKZ5_9HYPO|nr:hypothetical protein NLG97_g9066 [Lecanicillium saksenae]
MYIYIILTVTLSHPSHPSSHTSNRSLLFVCSRQRRKTLWSLFQTTPIYDHPVSRPSPTNRAAPPAAQHAISGATHGSAYSCFADGVTGSLEVGKKADFVVVEMEPTPEKLIDGVVTETWFEGKRVYKKE